MAPARLSAPTLANSSFRGAIPGLKRLMLVIAPALYNQLPHEIMFANAKKNHVDVPREHIPSGQSSQKLD
ncbi:hypothetical protein KCU61_g586, partial [Aureobasidium melanogenum]